MGVRGWLVRFVLLLVAGLCLGLGLHSCGVLNNAGTAPLEQVAALPMPQLPGWIEEISPTGQAEPLAQIRVRFKQPLIPLEALDSPDQQALLEKFQLTPNLPGRFRFLTPKMVGFEATQAIPKATRVRVTLKAGLKDLKNDQLKDDLAWTFNTETLKFTNIPGRVESQSSEDAPSPLNLKPTLTFTANTELDSGSLAEHLQLVPQGSQTGVGLTITPEDSAEPTPNQAFDASQGNWNYSLTPQSELSKDQTYQLKFTPGIRPARGNLASEVSLVSSLYTYAPLAFQKLNLTALPDADGAYGRFSRGRAQLIFNNGLVAESAKQNIKISPAPLTAPTPLRTFDQEPIVDLNPWSLAPNTTYKITLGANLKDQYGQTLGQPVEVEYQTGDVAADFWAPDGLNIFPAGKDLQLNLTAVNLPEPNYQGAFRILQPEDLVYADTASPGDDRVNLLPNSDQWQSFPIANPQPNQTSTITIPLRERLGKPTGMLAYGVKARTNQYSEEGKQVWRQPDHFGLVQLTNLGVFSQWFPGSGMVRVHHLGDGSAVSGASVSVYPSRLDAKTRSPVSACARGQTNPAGVVEFSSAQIAGCLPSENQNLGNAPQLLVVAQEGEDWAFNRILDYSGAYGYGIDTGWNGGTPESRGTIFSDRQLYQPGETGWFTGVAYYLQTGTLSQDKNSRYQVKLIGPEDKTIDLGSQTTNDYGTFSLEVPLAKSLPLGFYRIEASRGEDRMISGEFRLAEFKPPNFKVDLALDRTFAQGQEPIQAKVQSNYLSGPALSGATAKFYITRQPTNFTPKDWPAFSFGRQWFWPETRPEVTTEVLQTSQALSEQGQGSASFTVPADLPFAMDYRVDVEVADLANLSVADSQTVTAFPSQKLIGVKTGFVGDAKKDFPVEVIVTDPAGKPLDGTNLKLELQKINHSSVTQVVEGSQTARNQVEYKTLATATARSQSKPITVNLTPPEAGSYRIRVNLADANSEATATDTQIWITGDEPVFWGDQYTNERVEVKLDKTSYKPGEVATAAIQSPYPEAELYFAVVRNRVLYQQVQKVRGSAPEVKFTVTPEMLPNAAVEAILVRRGAQLGNQPTDLPSLASFGFAPFQIDRQELGLKVEVQPIQGTAPGQFLSPGSEQRVQMRLQDLQGRPVQGQLTVMAVNEAVLQLSGYRVPDLVETVYAEQPISLRFADNRADVVLQPLASPLEKGWGFGGGSATGAGSTRVRTDFRPLAYYNGAVLTDSQGQAEVNFKLPDDLTTWRVMVVAIDPQNRFGRGDATFMTSKTLMANPVLPQFVRPGDKFEAGLTVTNNSGQGGEVEITGTMPENGASAPPDGDPIFPLSFDQQNSIVDLKAQANNSTTQVFRFPMVANFPGGREITFQTKLGNDQDAFKLPLEVKDYPVWEQAVTTGVTESQVKIPVQVPGGDQVSATAGGLNIDLASTLIPQLKLPASQVLDEEQLPFLEPAASQLLLASNLQDLGKTYQQTFAEFNPLLHATEALAALQKLQRSDGGLASWPGAEKSDPYLSPLAAQAIARSQQVFPNLLPTGLSVDRLQAYLEKVLANPNQNNICTNSACRLQLRLSALLGLEALGQRRSDFLGDLVAERLQLDRVAQVQLARYLSLFPQWQADAQAQFKQIKETIYQTGRRATVNYPPAYDWLADPAVAQAETLQLFLSQKAPAEDIDWLLQALLERRRQGTWSTTYANAEAVAALVAVSKQESTPPNFTAVVQLASKELARQTFQGYTTIERRFRVPIQQLPKGKQELRLSKSGTGKLHYLAALRYQLAGVAPGRMNGLRVSRHLRAANQTQILNSLDLAKPAQPIVAQTGQILDIGLEVITDHPVEHLVITDPLPAGLETVDTAFQTATAYFQPLEDSWDIDYQRIHRDRIVAYADRLAAGVYNLHYLVRVVTPGEFVWPGAEAHLQYAPEEFGRSAAAKLEVK